MRGGLWMRQGGGGPLGTAGRVRMRVRIREWAAAVAMDALTGPGVRARHSWHIRMWI